MVGEEHQKSSVTASLSLKKSPRTSRSTKKERLIGIIQRRIRKQKSRMLQNRIVRVRKREPDQKLSRGTYEVERLPPTCFTKSISHVSLGPNV
jgi:hypothetical protein